MLARCRRCRALIPAGRATLCGDCRQISDRRPTARATVNQDFYNSTKWRKLSKHVKNMYNGFDVYEFYTTGKYRPARVVHHIEPLSDAPTLGLVILNLIPVSRRNHDLIEKNYQTENGARNMKKRLNEALRHWSVKHSVTP